MVKTIHTTGKGVFETEFNLLRTPGTLLLRPKLVGVCRSDIDMAFGHVPPLPLGMFGHEGLAEVIGGNENFPIGSYVATNADMCYADYFEADPDYCVSVPEIHPRWILEPIACATNIVTNFEKFKNQFSNEVLLLGTGFLSYIVKEILTESGYKIIPVGSGKHELWGGKSFPEIPSRIFYNIIDMSEKPGYCSSSQYGDGATILMCSMKVPKVETDFSSYLWKAQHLIFPSPRNSWFKDELKKAKQFIERTNGKLDSFWSHKYKRNDYQRAFSEGLTRGPNYSRGYIEYD